MKVINNLRENLLVGDLFEDGGRIFIIDEVYPNGRYKSHVVEKSFFSSEETSDVTPQASQEQGDENLQDDLTDEISEEELKELQREEEKEETDGRLKKSELEKLTREELIKIAAEQGRDSKGLKKQEIISLILS